MRPPLTRLLAAPRECFATFKTPGRIMRNVFVFACVARAIGGAAARYAEKMPGKKAPSPQQQSQTNAMAASVPPSSLSRTVSLQSEGRHFRADARVNGQPIDFI